MVAGGEKGMKRKKRVSLGQCRMRGLGEGVDSVG